MIQSDQSSAHILIPQLFLCKINANIYQIRKLWACKSFGTGCLNCIDWKLMILSRTVITCDEMECNYNYCLLDYCFKRHIYWMYQCVPICLRENQRQSNIYSTDTCQTVNRLRLRQNGQHFADDIFKCIFLNEDIWILINVSLKFVPKGQINNIPALVQLMAWHCLDTKPLSVTIVAYFTDAYMCRSASVSQNPLLPSNTILSHRSGSTLAQVMANAVLWHSCDVISQELLMNWIISKITSKSQRNQGVYTWRSETHIFVFSIHSVHHSDLQTLRFPHISINSLRPSDAIWRHKSGSTLA